jgi:hypothetical protein
VIAAKKNYKKKWDYKDKNPLGYLTKDRKIQKESAQIQNAKQGDEDNTHVHGFDLAPEFSDDRLVTSVRHDLNLQLHETKNGVLLLDEVAF